MAVTMAQLQKQWSQQDKEICRSVRVVLAAAQMTYEDIGRLMGISSQTVGDRMKKPSDFKVREWRVIEHLAEQYHVNIATI